MFSAENVGEEYITKMGVEVGPGLIREERSVFKIIFLGMSGWIRFRREKITIICNKSKMVKVRCDEMGKCQCEQFASFRWSSLISFTANVLPIFCYAFKSYSMVIAVSLLPFPSSVHQVISVESTNPQVNGFPQVNQPNPISWVGVSILLFSTSMLFMCQLCFRRQLTWVQSLHY